jgi:YD repeat-containing protein
VPYDFEVTKGAKAVPFDGQKYAPGDHFRDDDPCRAKQFLAAYRAANPKLGMKGFSAVTDELDQKCPMIVSDAAPQPSAFDTPTEADPQTLGGDSAVHQAAPAPPVGIIVTGTTTPTTPTPVPLGEEPRRPANNEPHPTNSADRPQANTTGGEPVDLFSGAFTLDETDLEIRSTILPLAFVRSYRSGTPVFGPFGWNWDHNFNLYVRELSSGDVGLWRGLREERFSATGAGFEPPRGVFEKLDQPALQVFELTAPGGGLLHFERPPGWTDADRIPLIRVQDRHGNTLTLSYDNENRLMEVRDDDDRLFAFTYDACGLLVAVADHTGRRVAYEHDEETMHMVRATSPAIADHPKGLSRYYFYGPSSAAPEIRHNLLRIADAEGNIFVENNYNEDPSSWAYGRVVSQYVGSYLFQFCSRQLQLVPPNPVHANIPAVAVEVLNPDFGLEIYTFNYRGDLLDRRYRLNKDRSFRVVVWQYEFDAQGNQIVVTRPDGSQELSTYDAANADPRMRGKMLKREVTSASGFPAPSRILWTGTYEPTFQLLVEEKGERGDVTKYRFDFDLSPGNPANSGCLRETIHPVATLPDGTKQQAVTGYEWNTKGQLTARVCPDGVRTELFYGAAGPDKSRLVRVVVDVGGLNTEATLAYDAVGFDSRWTDANGNETQYVFNALGLIETTVLPVINGGAAQFRLRYNIDKRVSAAERPRGAFNDAILAGAPIIDRFDLDVLGYRTAFVLSSNTAEARTLRFACDFRGVPVDITNPDGSRIQRVYDERGLQVRETLIGADGATLTSKRSYHRTGTLRQEISTAGDVTTYEYDGFGRLFKTTQPNQTEVIRRWLPGDLLESEETTGDDGSGAFRLLARTRYEYDEKGRRVRESVRAFVGNSAAGTDLRRTIFYDQVDRQVRVVDHRNAVTQFSYDAFDHVCSRRPIRWATSSGGPTIQQET